MCTSTQTHESTRPRAGVACGLQCPNDSAGGKDGNKTRRQQDHLELLVAKQLVVDELARTCTQLAARCIERFKASSCMSFTVVDLAGKMLSAIGHGCTERPVSSSNRRRISTSHLGSRGRGGRAPP